MISRRWSRTGIILFYGDAVIYISDYTQKRVTLSAAKSEFVRLLESCLVISLLTQVLQKVDVAEEPMKHYQDNAGAIKSETGGTGKHFPKRKNIELRPHYVFDKLDQGNI